MTIKRYHLKSLSILLLSVFACSKPQEKKEPARLAQTVTKTVHDTVYVYRSDASAAPYVNDFERIHVDSIDARRNVTKLKHSPETRLLGDIDTAITVKAERLFLRVYSRTAGPLEIEETHGVYANVMISVSDYGEYATNQVFTVGPFLGAKFKNGKDLGDHYEIEVHHGHDYKKKTRLAIYLDKVVMLKS